nr:CHAP domain-containing protein [Desmospora activa]
MVEEDQLVIGDRVAGGSGDQYPYKEANTSGVDPWGFYIRQCTSFVAWRLNDAGIEFHNTMRGGRFSNAENWDDNARELGVKVNNKPAVGAVAQWDAGAFGHSNLGHVAYVVEVDGDRITIEEYNYEPYSFSKRSIPASQVSNFIHFR